MSRLTLLAFATPMLLVGAALPDDIGKGPDDYVVQAHYRPCRPGPGDDRCIQLYERGVRLAYARWQRIHTTDRAARLAMGGPEEAAPPPRMRMRQVMVHQRRHDAMASAMPRCHEPPVDSGEALGM